MALILEYTGPEPVSVDEAKLAARVDVDDLDDEITSLISAARGQAEDITGRCYREQVQRYELTDWPSVCDALPTYGATACAITFWDGAAWSDPLDAAQYAFAAGGLGDIATILAPVTAWPVLGARIIGARVRIDLTAGPSEGDIVPDQVKTYIKASVSAWLKTPEAQGAGREGVLTPNPLFARLLDGQKLRN